MRPLLLPNTAAMTTRPHCTTCLVLKAVAPDRANALGPKGGKRLNAEKPSTRALRASVARAIDLFRCGGACLDSVRWVAGGSCLSTRLVRCGTRCHTTGGCRGRAEADFRGRALPYRSRGCCKELKDRRKSALLVCYTTLAKVQSLARPPCYTCGGPAYRIALKREPLVSRSTSGEDWHIE